MEKEACKILLVDDDEDDYVITRQLLVESRGGPFQLDWADSFEKGLEAFRHGEHQVYLIDYRLGAQDGLDLVRRATALGCKAPVIVLTGQGSYDVDLEAMHAGATDYLVKSEATPQLLERTIRYALERKQAEENLREMRRSAIRIEVQHRLIQNRETERLHIAQELHDGPLQDLIGITFKLADILQGFEEGEIRSRLHDVQAALQNQIRELRAFSSELRPPTLSVYGLEKAIRSHADTFHNIYPNLEISLELDPDRRQLPPEVRLALFRIYQEAMNNVARHSGATKVLVTLHLDKEYIELAIHDNGAGFALPKDLLDLVRSGHLGLLGIQERVEAVGGKLELKSTAENGTTLRVTVPRVQPSADSKQS